MSPTEVLTEPQVLTNQTRILKNQEGLKTTQQVIQDNQADILKNQEKLGFILKNQARIISRLEK